MLKCKKCGRTSFSTILNNSVCSECYKEFQRQEAAKLEEYHALADCYAAGKLLQCLANDRE